MPKKFSHELVAPIGGDCVDIFFDTNRERLYKTLYEWYGFTPPAHIENAIAWVWHKRGCQFIACYVPKKSPTEVVGHEAIHLTKALMQAYGEDSPLDKAEETFCLIWEALFTQMLRKVK